ncbi:TM0996/MTH895 family glutaredoxin-like protein [Candidatus Bipolaricaulota bacterium]|nr:TM0996/MTH895 family glutaredoxin-like protein [Candidatus Bipolaricaulota bacterium]
MKIEILGTGCPKCQTLLNNVEAAVGELGVEATVSKVTDIVEIATRGVMMTPALSVDGEIKLVGSASTVEELKILLG